ncbi:MAG: flavodoxin family protein [Selenomonadaceae bacterium]|nr:flavodoxin family protein [Selenomonadaceae bacterium]
MKKLFAINGSPRRNENTAQLLKAAMQGAEEAGAKTELVHLYSLNFKGCISCFACKLKNREHGICAMKDDLSPILEQIKQTDAIVFGSPIYFMNITAGMVAFLERFLFSNYLYTIENSSVFPKAMPSAFFYTMNATEEQAAKFHLEEKIGFYDIGTENMLKVKPQRLMAYNTVQFKDYSKYEASMFSEEDKRAYHDANWSRLCDEARQIGRNLIEQSV